MVKSFDVNVDEFLAEIDENIATQRQIIGSYINCYIDPEEWKKIKYKVRILIPEPLTQKPIETPRGTGLLIIINTDFIVLYKVIKFKSSWKHNIY